MRKITSLLIFVFLLYPQLFHAQESTIVKNAASTDDFQKFRFGGYGEMAASYLDYDQNRLTPTGSYKKNRGEISIPRFIVAFDYKFSSSWILGAEIEFEYGGTGVAREIEWAEEGGEWEVEIEKGGEVALEQFHITKLIHPAFNIRVGHMILPVGLTNARHEPINFFGVYRPEGETAILPSTWHENGIAFFGGFKGFDYEVMMVAGLDPNGFRDSDWIKNGKQGAFEVDNFSSPAFVGRVNYSGIKGLRLGTSLYFNRTAPNAGRPDKTANINADVTIFTADAQYRNRNFIARGNVIYGNLQESDLLSTINRRLSKSSGYPRKVVAKNAVSYGIEAGYNVGSFWGDDAPRVFPFVRYEYYNPMEKTLGTILADKRYQVSKWTVGANYYALPNLVVKAEYGKRIIGGGDYNNENMLSMGIAYIGWFLSK